MDKSEDMLSLLQQLYEALQLLNRKLVTAHASGIMSAVGTINSLLPRAGECDPSTMDPEDAKKAREIVRHIQVLQQHNRAVCDGGLKIISHLAGQSIQACAYDESGKLNEAVLADVNVSA